MNNSENGFHDGLDRSSGALKKSMNRKTTAGISEPVMEIGRDEMNLADLPLTVLASRAPKGIDSLVFEDSVWNKGRKEWMNKRLTVTASVKYGLPTASDDEVILGLVQLTYSSGFVNRRLAFVPAELFRILGWAAEGRAYRRLAKSLRRWHSVAIHYDHAWWDNKHKTWRDRDFHLLEDLDIPSTRKRSDKSPKRRGRVPWNITWNPTVFKSFQDGYLRELDMGIFRMLKSPAAKRMYRFLGKRFYYTSRLSFDLRGFACERIGFSRNYDNSQLKRKLDEAIRELEQVGFLEPSAKEQRYRQVRRGEWKVAFIEGSEWKEKKSSQSPDTPLEAVLTDRGVKQHIAAKLVQEGSHEAIRQCVREHDEMLKSGGGANLTNPPGLLVSVIRERLMSAGTGRRRKQSSKTENDPSPGKLRSAKRKQTGDESTESHRKLQAVRGYLAKLSSEERTSLEAEAIQRANPVQRAGYRRAGETGNLRLLEEYRNVIVESHVLRLLGTKARNG